MISYEGFERQAAELCEDAIHGYINATTHLYQGADGLDAAATELEEAWCEDDDFSAIPVQPSHRIEANIVWHAPYQVPTMLFRVYSSEGSLLGAEQSAELLLGSTSCSVEAEQVNDVIEFVTQEEHPVTGKPWLMLHPCKTKERMQHVLVGCRTSAGEDRTTDDELYLLRWLAMVGPIVHIQVSPQAFRDAQAR